MSQRETVTQLDQSYFEIVKRQFKKNRRAVWSLRFVYLIVFIAVIADFLANEKPIFCGYEGSIHAPVFKQYAVDLGMSNWEPKFQAIDWDELEYDWAIWPLVPYLPNNNNLIETFENPFKKQDVKSWRWRHWLGTDHIGRDVTAGMIHGTRIAVAVGVVSMSIASLIGIFLGSLAGYYGDNRFKMSRIAILMNLVSVDFAFFYSFHVRSFTLTAAFEEGLLSFIKEFHLSLFMFLGIMVAVNLVAMPLKKLPWLGTRVKIPVDILISRMIEIFTSVPRLLLLLAIVAVAPPSIMLVMTILGLLGWTGIARFIRGEILRVRSLEYIEAAQALGYPEWRIILKHVIPNSLTPVFISIAFGIAVAILTESSLSFLGIGVPADTMTWGKLLSIGRSYPEAWWLAIFPGFAIFITVTLYNLLGEGLTDALDPRLKQ